MNAVLLHRERLDLDDGSIVEMVLWFVSKPVAGSCHPYKYRLYFGRGGIRLVGYDNEHGKGDHRHRRGIEEPYRFTTVEQLVSDFLKDVAEERQR
jgi:hypothetical protein